MTLCAGDWAEVRSKEEILHTLDEKGRLESLPFMPQMFRYCGQRFRVHSRAYKTCDTVSGHYVGRRMPGGVHLDIRCDGQAHGGCQAGCLIFWKEAWLKAADEPSAAAAVLHPASRGCTESNVREAVTYKDASGERKYSCQATELLNYSKPLEWWDARQYIEAYTSGNRSAHEIVRGLGFLFYYYATLACSERWGKPSRWAYNQIQRLIRGTPFPRMKGKIPAGMPTPVEDLGLQPGEYVRIKSYERILSTLDTRLSNRGLWFDAELVPYCGKTFRVSARVERFVDERNGRMRRLKTPAVILDNVTCNSLYSGQRLFCPRSIHLWWREIWLERIAFSPQPAQPIPANPAQEAAE